MARRSSKGGIEHSPTRGTSLRKRQAEFDLREFSLARAELPGTKLSALEKLGYEPVDVSSIDAAVHSVLRQDQDAALAASLLAR